MTKKIWISIAVVCAVGVIYFTAKQLLKRNAIEWNSNATRMSEIAYAPASVVRLVIDGERIVVTAKISSVDALTSAGLVWALGEEPASHFKAASPIAETASEINHQLISVVVPSAFGSELKEGCNVVFLLESKEPRTFYAVGRTESCAEGSSSSPEQYCGIRHAVSHMGIHSLNENGLCPTLHPL